MMRPNTVRKWHVRGLLAAVLIGGAVGWTIGGATEARADGYINDAEYAYINTWGPTAICPVIATYPTKAGVFGVMAGIIDDGFAPDSAVDIINESVSIFCPGYWGLLVRIGDEARAGGGVRA